jgi:hypothetical protein
MNGSSKPNLTIGMCQGQILPEESTLIPKEINLCDMNFLYQLEDGSSFAASSQGEAIWS